MQKASTSYRTQDIAVYAGFLQDEEELSSCTSGGIATALSRYIIQNGGYVAGVSYRRDFHAAGYEIVSREDDLNRFKGSKYITAEKGGVFQDVKELLEKGKAVLFFGTPCVTAALRSYLKTEYKKLITCDLVCHGPARMEVHEQYIAYLEKKSGSRITDFSVRKKKETWFPAYLYARFENGDVFEREFYSTEYGHAFRMSGMDSCYKCRFKGNDRTGDLMLGDFLGAAHTDEFWNPKGVSVIFVRTQKGLDVLHALQGIRLYETTFQKAAAHNPMVVHARKPREGKEKFDRLFMEKGLIYAARHTRSLKEQAKILLKAFKDKGISSGLKGCDVIFEMKKLLPWRIRLGLSLLSAKYPGIFPKSMKQHMSLEEYNEKLYSRLSLHQGLDVRNKVICELGCGEYFSHAAVLYQMGAEKIYLTEIKDIADENRKVREEELQIKRGIKAVRCLPAIREAVTWKAYFADIHTEYFYSGLDGYRRIPDDSVDFAFSCTVLQHVRKRIFRQTIQETYRFLKKGGIISHRVDLRDCFGGGKNQLRYSEKVWEDQLHYNMDNYTNRLSCSQMLEIFKETGFTVVSVDKTYFKKLPISRKKLDVSFRNMTDEDLCTGSFLAVCRK